MGKCVKTRMSWNIPHNMVGLKCNTVVKIMNPAPRSLISMCLLISVILRARIQAESVGQISHKVLLMIGHPPPPTGCLTLSRFSPWGGTQRQNF